MWFSRRASGRRYVDHKTINCPVRRLVGNIKASIGAILHSHREEVLMDIRESSNDNPACDEPSYERVDEEDHTSPEDRCYVDDSSGNIILEKLTT